MATTIRPVLSEKNKYYIDKHRYYELKHFCLQYQEWKKEYSTLDGYDSYNVGLGVKTSDISDRTADYGITRAYYSNRIDMIERVARLTNLELSFYILNNNRKTRHISHKQIIYYIFRIVNPFSLFLRKSITIQTRNIIINK